MCRNELDISKLDEKEQKIVSDYMTRLFQIGIEYLTNKK